MEHEMAHNNTDSSSCCNDDGLDFSLRKIGFSGPVTCVKFHPPFFFVAQGPYLTRSRERILHQVDDADSEKNRPYQLAHQLLVFTDKFCGSRRGGGTIHGIHFLDDNKNKNPNQPKRTHHTTTVPPNNYASASQSSWDAIVYGGNRLAFCNIEDGDNIMTRRDVIHQGGGLAAKKSERNFVNSSSSIIPFLELGDWIWNVKTITKNTTTKLNTRMVVGYARHMVEVWNLEEESTVIVENSTNEHIALERSFKSTATFTTGRRRTVINSTCLRRFFLDPSTIVTSMDFVFLKQENHQKGNCNEINTLGIAAGTSFHKIWISYVPLDYFNGGSVIDDKGREEYDVDQNRTDTDLSKSSTPISINYLLEGHLGVVHCVRWFKEKGRLSLATTSDDRSVRKWVWSESKQKWINKWVGWGHSARVWSVADLTVSSLTTSSSTLLTVLISVSEDGTARIWSNESGHMLGCMHHSTTLRTIDTCCVVGVGGGGDGMILIGGTDGISFVYNLRNHIISRTNNMFEVPIPDDRPSENAIEKTSNNTCSGTDTCNGIFVTKEIAENNQITSAIETAKEKKKRKKKLQVQIIIGVKCWSDRTGKNSSLVLVATRQGSLMSLNIDTKQWESLEPWWEQSIGEKYGIQSVHGCCMVVNDANYMLAVGTTLGDIILTSIDKGKDRIKTVLRAHMLRGVQGLCFVDSFCLVSFHVKSVAIWKINFETPPNNAVVQLDPIIVLSVETKGIPLSCAYDQVNHRIILGDSRGNLLYYNTKNINNMQGGSISATHKIHRVHQKQHVMSIKWLNKYTILSAGNDGCIHVSYLIDGIFKRGFSYPSPSITGISTITRSSKPTIVSGYYGNTFVVKDIDSGYEYIRAETGGRQRILDYRSDIEKINLGKTPLRYQVIVCKGIKDGSNSLFVQHSPSQVASEIPTEGCFGAKGAKLHNETIFGSTSFTLTNQEIVFLVTASEDCSSRISAWNQGSIIDSVPLTPQESCCRCVASSKLNDKSVFLAIGGGKLTLQFFLVKVQSNSTIVKSTQDLEITFIGKGSTRNKGDIDHRMNAVQAVTLLGDKSQSQLVVGGDSNGCFHIFVVKGDDNEDCSNIVRGFSLPTISGRPILSIAIVTVRNRFLIFMGSTGGDVIFLDVPGTLSELLDLDEDANCWNPIGKYLGHQMGANCIVAQIPSLEVTKNGINASVLVITGGDDQSLCISRIQLKQIGDCNSPLNLVHNAELSIFPEASSSAIKGVSLLRFRGQNYIIAVGYSQQLSVWRINSEIRLSLQFLSSVSVDLGDVNSLSVCGKSPCFVAVCGMGVEMFQQEHDEFKKIANPGLLV